MTSDAGTGETLCSAGTPEKSARRGGGPRTPEGKTISRANSLRHGLTVAGQGFDSQEINTVARSIWPLEGPLPEAAVLAAEAQIRIRRIRAAKHMAIHEAMARVEAEGDLIQREEIEARGLSSCAERLLTLDDYERKALSRRKKAIRAMIG